MTIKFTNYVSGRFNDVKAAASEILWPRTIWRTLVRGISHVVISIAVSGAALDFLLWYSGPIDSSVTPPVPPGAPFEVLPDAFGNYMAGLFLVKAILGIAVYLMGVALGGFRYRVIYKSDIEAAQSIPVAAALRSPQRSPDQ